MCRQRDERRPNRFRWLPALAVLATLVTEASLAQAPAPPPAPSAATATQLQPTPEDTGDALLARQRYQAAIEAYKKAPSGSATAWNKMGVAYQMMFNLQDATRCYQASLKLNPNNATVLNNLGAVYDSQKNYSAAERMYRRAMKLEPRSALILKNLGTAQLAQGKYKKGWESYQAALAIDQNIFEKSEGPQVSNPASVQDRGAMNYYMAKGCVRAGQNERAIDYLRMALNEGFATPKMIVADKEFAGLRGVPAFEQLLAERKAP